MPPAGRGVHACEGGPPRGRSLDAADRDTGGCVSQPRRDAAGDRRLDRGGLWRRRIRNERLWRESAARRSVPEPRNGGGAAAGSRILVRPPERGVREIGDGTAE